MEHTLEVGSRRRCDNCGRPYTVQTKTHRFHSDNCRKEFHRFGAPLLRLRDRINKEVERATDDLEFRLYTALDVNGRARYHEHWPDRGRKFDARRQEENAAAR